jgi:predicted ABC-type ATPase
VIGRPTVHVIAGPNGAGKTTFALEFLPRIAGCRTFINADLIAGGLSPLHVEAAASQAGRLFLAQIHSHVAARETFAFETTLAGVTYEPLFGSMREFGFFVRIYFLWIPSAELGLKRIAERVRRGGHDVPAEVVRRRYGRGLANLFDRYLPLTDYCAIFDNTSVRPRLVYEWTHARERIIVPETFERISQQGGKRL